jgi:Na+/H+ antiporter NhaD/arsenite permease-like protein
LLTAGILFVATYVVVALGRVPGLRLDRTGAAVVGAAFMVAFHVVTPKETYRFVDLGTLVLLFGMMVIVGHLKLAGFFRWAGAFVVRRAGTPRALLAGLILVAGLLSALFVNDTVCLALTPLVLEVAGALGVRATPYLLALAGNLTLVGSIANLIVAEGAPAHLAPHLRGVPEGGSAGDLPDPDRGSAPPRLTAPTGQVYVPSAWRSSATRSRPSSRTSSRI